MCITSRVQAIREWLKQNNLDAFIVPHEDEFLGEYLPAHNERLRWLTGFTGSAGAAIITTTNAAIFVDGRYTVQVKSQAPADLFEHKHSVDEPLLAWLKFNSDTIKTVAYDPRLHSVHWLNKAVKELDSQVALYPIDSNPIDLFWSTRPTPRLSRIYLMPLEHSGEDSSSKRQRVARALRDSGADHAIITQLDSISWILNIRGDDISRLPVVLSQAILHANGNVELFIDANRTPHEFANHVGTGVSVYSPELLPERLAKVAGKRVLVDPSHANIWLQKKLEALKVDVILGADPCIHLKAPKNDVEINGMKDSHVKDGIAMVKFLSWLDDAVSNSQYYNEAQLADKLEEFRRIEPSLMDLSFDTISAASSNAAMCHYNHLNQPQPAKIVPNSLYLVDFGGQYTSGTTDITRTIAIGAPNNTMKKQFTLVLKGHIALATAKFPKGTTGSQLDVLARQYLWQHGFDYDHGTGHGVGHFLSVHEGPQRIAKAGNDIKLIPGMVLSNEPGYYKSGEFGIRIENLELVTEYPTNGDFPVLGFESLTLCPIDKRCIDVSLLSPQDVSWLDKYHQRVWITLSGLLEENEKTWLHAATLPLCH